MNSCKAASRETPTAILGISAFYHDSAAALTIDGEIVAAAHEERFTRIKGDASFPRNACTYVLAESGTSLEKIATVVFYDKPLLKFQRLLETYLAFAPRGSRSFAAAMSIWMKDKLFMRRMIRSELSRIGRPPARISFCEHHLSHAASAFYPSPFDDAAILTVDGVGEWATTTIGHGHGKDITFLREQRFPHSLGLLYSSFTHYCGFRINSGEYKLMGLAPYGDPESLQVQQLRTKILEELVDLREDGSFLLNMDYFDFPVGFRMCNLPRWERLLGMPARVPESKLNAEYVHLALAIQLVTEQIIVRLAKSARAITNSKNLVLAGGVALNCVAIGRLKREAVFDRIWVQPSPGDAGGALGAALAAWHIGMGQPRAPLACGAMDRMAGSYLGPSYEEADVRSSLRRCRARAKHIDSVEELCSTVAAMLASGSIVGWFHGRMEWGPRALGNRSILADARHPDMQKRLNLRTKFRESFRPFAPAVLAEDAPKFFALEGASPYMQVVAPIHAALREEGLPADTHSDPLERLHQVRSKLPAVTHVDYSSRIQTVHRETNERFWSLLVAFKRLTGCGVLVNTSFNVRGEPIVCTPEDAYRCFMKTEMDCLVINDFLLMKAEQPAWKDGWAEADVAARD